MKLRQKSERWYAVATTYSGGKSRETWHALPVPRGASRRVAMRALVEYEASASTASPTVTVSDLVQRFVNSRAAVVRAKTMTIYRHWATRFEAAYGSSLIAALSPAEIEAWQRSLIDEGLAPASVHQAMRTIRSVFVYAARSGIIQKSPADAVAMIRIPKTGYPPFITMDEFRAVLESVEDPVLRAAFGLAMYAGLRLSEVANLRWENIDIEARVITVTSGNGWETKSGRARQVPLYHALGELLDALPKRRGLVIGCTGSWITHKWTRTWRDHVERASRSTRISRGFGPPRRDLATALSFHGLRHSFATWAALHVPLPVLQSLLGHASITTTMIYAQVRPSMAVEEAKKHEP